MTWLRINNKPVSFAYRQKVANLIGDPYQAALIFYRCIQANPNDYAAWMHDGMFGEEKFAYTACKDEYDNKPAVNAWIKEYWKNVNVRRPDKLGKRFTKIAEQFKDDQLTLDLEV